MFYFLFLKTLISDLELLFMRCQQECENKQQELENVTGRKEKIVFYVKCENMTKQNIEYNNISKKSCKFSLSIKKNRNEEKM